MIEKQYLEVIHKIKEIKDTKNCKQKTTLIAVSKTKPVEDIRKIYDVGCRDFGENKVQELVNKYEILPKDIHWHMIGHLQRNKVKYIIDKVSYIHSVDSVRLAEEINKQAFKYQRIIKILLEINVSKEDSKFGIYLENLTSVYHEISNMKNVQICGLMTVAPNAIDSEENRKYFRKLKQVLVDIQQKNIDNTNMSELSMGMSKDYLVAVEEGATFLRVGTEIFGQRDYSNMK